MPRSPRTVAMGLAAWVLLGGSLALAAEPREPIRREARAAARRILAIESHRQTPRGPQASLGKELKDLRAALRRLASARTESEADEVLARIEVMRAGFARHAASPAGLQAQARDRLPQLEARLAALAATEALAERRDRAAALLLGLEYQILHRQFENREDRGSTFREPQ